jgi:glycosyltransferase involved in cell wall biosynthesis
LDRIKLSIIVPFYNVQKYFAVCLDSILQYKQSDIEVLLIDDCGQDDSRAIAKQYALKDSRVRLIVHSNNCGLGGARNTGILEAKGEYVWFVDSDDLIVNNCVAKLLSYVKIHNLDALLFGIVYLFNSDFKNAYLFNYFDHKKNFCFNGNLLILEDKVDKNIFFKNIANKFCNAWAMLFKRNFLLENNFMFKQNNYHEDAITLLWLFKCDRLGYLQNSHFYCYRIRYNSIMRQKIKPNRYCHNINMMGEILQLVDSDDDTQNFIAYNRLFRLCIKDTNPFVKIKKNLQTLALKSYVENIFLARQKLKLEFDMIKSALVACNVSDKNAITIANAMVAGEKNECEKAIKRQLRIIHFKKMMRAILPFGFVKFLQMQNCKKIDLTQGHNFIVPKNFWLKNYLPYFLIK